MKLEKLVKHLRGCDNKGWIISYTNIDDIFRVLKDIDVKEIKVDDETMSIIVGFVIANSRGDLGTVDLMREGKIDKFMGIKLV